MGDRSRSRSPHRRGNDVPPRPKKTGGFRWKDKRRDDTSHDGRRLERGYRDRSRSPRRQPEGDRYGKNSGDNRERRHSYRERNDDSRDGRRLERDHRDRDQSRSPRCQLEGDRHGKSSRDIRERGGSDRGPDTPESRENKAKKETKEKKEKKEKKVISNSSERMIVVHVNDRLGTKAAIPCLASDPIKLFKAYVAARIGREAHEILLKRQGERPFKDGLTLEDYGVSNGVQLDLEVGTGE